MCVRAFMQACVRSCVRVCVCKCVRACVRMSVAPAACLSASTPPAPHLECGEGVRGYLEVGHLHLLKEVQHDAALEQVPACVRAGKRGRPAGRRAGCPPGLGVAWMEALRGMQSVLSVGWAPGSGPWRGSQVRASTGWGWRRQPGMPWQAGRGTHGQARCAHAWRAQGVSSEARGVCLEEHEVEILRRSSPRQCGSPG